MRWTCARRGLRRRDAGLAVLLAAGLCAAASAPGASSPETRGERRFEAVWRFTQASGGQADAFPCEGGLLTAARASGRGARADAAVRVGRPPSSDGRTVLRLDNAAAALDHSGVFLRVADHAALTGHDRDGGGFESLRLFVRIRLHSLDRTQSLVRKTNGSSENGYLLGLRRDNRIRFAVANRARHASVTSRVHLERGRWYEIDGVWDGRRLSLLVDGKPAGAPRRFAGRLDNTTGPLAIGAIDRGDDSTGQFLDGWLDEVHVSASSRERPKGDDAMTSDPSVTAWGEPMKRMWFCPAHQWGSPALGVPLAKGVRHAPVFEPEYEDGAYNHHPELAWRDGRFYAMWSNNRIGEDRAGQRVLCAVTDNVASWPPAKMLFPQPGEFWDHRQPSASRAGRAGFYMTALKWVPLDGRLFAVAAFDSTRKRITPLAREVRADGSLGEVFALRARFTRDEAAGFPFAIALPDREPYANWAAGLLRLCLTPEFLPSWNFGIEDLLPRPRAVEGHALCEWSMHRASDGRWVMLARDLRHSHRMYAAVSDKADPSAFPALAPTDIPDSPSKAVTVTLDSGVVLLIGNQLARDLDDLDTRMHYDRDPLTVSISPDGYRFERQLSLRWEGGRRWRVDQRRVHGRGPGCQYPAALVHDGVLYVIYSIGKEDIAVSWVELARLGL